MCTKRNAVHCWWEGKLVQPLWKKLKIEAPSHPVIVLLGIYATNTNKQIKQQIQRDTPTPMFIAAVFTIAKLQIMHLSIDRWTDMEDVVYIYKGILFSHKKEWNLTIRNNMNVAREYNAKWNKPVRERKTPYDLTHMWHLRNKANELKER